MANRTVSNRLIPKLIEQFPGAKTSELFICEALSKTAATSDPVWRISRVVSLGGDRKQTTLADKGIFDQICDDREVLFPPSPFINTLALRFDGVASNARTAINPAGLAFERTTPFTLSVWIKPDDLVSSQTIMDKQLPVTFQGWGFLMSGNKIRFILRNSTTNSLTVDSNTLIDSLAWQHWAATYDGTSTPGGVKLYKNGVLSATTTITNNLTATTISNERVRLGLRGALDSAYDGLIDEPSIWNRVLTQAEVVEIYNAGIATNLLTDHSSPGNLLAYWHNGDNDIFPLITDLVGSNDLTMTNMVAEDIVADVAA